MKRTFGFCVFAGLLSLSCCTVTRSGYLAKANKLFDAGKYAEASLNYRKAIQKDPQFGESYYRLGLVAIKQGDPRQAYEALTRAVELLPDDIDVKEKLSSIALSYYLLDSRHPKNLYNQLMKISADLLAKNPNSFEGLRVKGYMAITDRKPADAIQFFRKAVQTKRDPIVKTTLADVLAQNGQLQEAEKVGLEVVAEAKDYSPAYNVLYTLYVSSKRIDDAEKILQARVTNNPKQSIYVLQLAEHYADYQKPAELARTLQRILDRPKDFPQARLQVADFYAGRKNFAEAARYYQEGIQTNSADKLVYQQRTVGLLLQEGKQDEAANLMEQILKEHPKDQPTLRLRASLWVERGSAANLDAAISDLQALLKQSPDDRFLLLNLGQALRRKGDLDAATAQLLQAMKDRGDLAPRYELAEIALERGQGKQAVQYSSEILAYSPANGRARLLHAMGLMATRDFDVARGELTALIKDDPHNAQAQMQLGTALLAQKNYPQAAELFEKLRQDASVGPRATSALASTYLSENQPDKAAKLLEDALKKSPNSTSMRSELAVSDFRAGKYDAAIQEFRQVLATDPKLLKGWLALGEVYDLKGDLDNSISAYQKARELAPKDPVPPISLATVFAKAGRIKEARACYEDVLKADPNNVSALNNLAFMLSDDPVSLDEALRLAQRAIQIAPQEPGFMDTLGYIYLKRNMLDSALQTFAVLAQKYPAYPTFRYHFGLALLAKGDKTKAAAEFKAALANHPSRLEEAKINQLLQNKS